MFEYNRHSVDLENYNQTLAAIHTQAISLIFSTKQNFLWKKIAINHIIDNTIILSTKDLRK